MFQVQDLWVTPPAVSAYFRLHGPRGPGSDPKHPAAREPASPTQLHRLQGNHKARVPAPHTGSSGQWWRWSGGPVLWTRGERGSAQGRIWGLIGVFSGALLSMVLLQTRQHQVQHNHELPFLLEQRQSYTPQLTPRRPPNMADLRSSLLFDSCETISITSLGEVTVDPHTCTLSAVHSVCSAVTGCQLARKSFLDLLSV